MPREFQRFTICGYDRAHGLSSGTGVGLVSLARWFADRGIAVQVLMLHLGETSDCPFIQKLLSAGNIRCETLSMDRYPDAARQTRWILNRVRDFRPDVFCPNYAAPGIFAARSLARAEVPVIVVLHSTSAHSESILSCLRSGYLERPPKIVAVSQRLADQAAANLGAKVAHGISVISCGTPIPERFVTAGPDPDIHLLYAGRFIDYGKRIFDVANAMMAVCASRKNARGTMIGDGKDWTSVQDHVRSHDTSKRVEVLPAVTNSQLAERLLASHVFLMLSEHEGLPIALLEAMAAGLVPIGPAGAPGISEVIRSGKNGILVNDRTVGVVSAVRSLVECPDMWRRLSREARKTIIEQYSLDVENEKWLACCRELCVESRAWVRQPSWRIRLPGVPLAEGDLRRPPLKDRLRSKAKTAVMAARLAVRPRARLRELRNRWGA